MYLAVLRPKTRSAISCTLKILGQSAHTHTPKYLKGTCLQGVRPFCHQNGHLEARVCLLLHTSHFIGNDTMSSLLTNRFTLNFRAIVAYVAYFNCYVGEKTVSL